LYAGQINEEIKKEIVEGLVINEDGLAYWHYWNRFIWGNQTEDRDITLTVIASQEEIDTPKTYYELQSYPLKQIKNKSELFQNGCSEELDSIIEDYYSKNPEQKERYNKSKSLLNKN
jgi:ferredoxin-thioredoxin reductase catalytic subunit